MKLRTYQSEAIDACYSYLRAGSGNPCIVIPTGGGKTPVLASICRDAVQKWSGRVLVLAHVKELLEQAVDKLNAMAPDLPIGVYSASLKSRELEHDITVAGIQSIYRRACELGAVDLVIIDEAHLIPPSGDGMYRRFLKDMSIINPKHRVIGLTATPYRTSSGWLCGPGEILSEVCYEVSIPELIQQGFLCPVRSKSGTKNADFDKLHVRGGEFIASEVAELMDDDLLVSLAVTELIQHTEDRKSVLIFASGINHAQHIQEEIESRGYDCGFVSGETLFADRADTIERFQSGDLKYLVNVNVLTTGFDAPNIDCVALLRPTQSPGLYYQMVGRGFRICQGKDDCLVLDFGGNVARHGPVDRIRPTQRDGRGGAVGGAGATKTCPECMEIVAAGFLRCPACDHEFPEKGYGHASEAGDDAVLSGDNTPYREEFEVQSVGYALHHKRGWEEGDPVTLRVEYRVGLAEWEKEWICFEHEGFARRRAESWWAARSSLPCPESSEEALRVAESGGLREPVKITVKVTPGEKFPRRIKDYELGDYREPTSAWAIDEADLPF